MAAQEAFIFEYTEDLCVAFLDLLGFKSFVNENTEGAVEMLYDARNVYSIKQLDDKMFTEDDYSTKAHAKRAREIGVGSICISIPFSDSLVLLSRDPSLFATQLAHYMGACFSYTSRVFTESSSNNPMEVVIPNVTKSASGQMEIKREVKKWFPIMYRGGVSCGEFKILPSKVLIGDKGYPIPNVVGKAYVESVLYEGKSGKGPRLFCHPSFVEKLDEQIMRYVVPVQSSKIDGDVYELLWPAFLFIEQGDPEIEANDIPEMLRPILVLAEHYKDDEESIPHYIEFIRLIARSSLYFFKYQSAEQLAIDRIEPLVPKDILVSIPEWPKN